MYTFWYLLPAFMKELVFYINSLSAPQKAYVSSFFSGKKTLAAQLVCLIMNGVTGKENIAGQLDISPAMLNKISTQAKQDLLEKIKKFAENPYDEIFFLKALVLKGDFSPAKKLFLQLEKHFETMQKWQHLELLYVEGARFCQATGNLILAKQLAAKRKKNAKRLNYFIELSTELNNLLFEFEVYEQKKLPGSFSNQTKNVLKKARLSGHYTLIHNALQLQYLFYSRYTNKFAEVKKLAEAIYANKQKHTAQLNEITDVLALNVYANYISIYKGQLSAKLIGEIQQKIARAGKHAIFNFYYVLLDYYLFDNKFAELDTALKQMENIEDNTKFTVYRYGILSVKAFKENNVPGFKEYVHNFYKNPNRLDFPEVECFLRILEIIRLISEKKDEDALYKLNSLRVFIDRNLSERYLYERSLVGFLGRHIKGLVKEQEREIFLRSLERSPYRNIRFLAALPVCRDIIRTPFSF